MSAASHSSDRTAWTMLAVLMTAFALSQAFRTVAAIMAPPLASELRLSPQQLGLFAAAFHFSFAGFQFFMGMGIDVYGARRTVLAVFPLAIAGALVAALAQGFGGVLLGQVLIGMGCAPAFLACTVFISRHFAPERFAAVSGMTLGIGSVGLLLTGTPLALVIELLSWRAGFVTLALCAAVSWLAILLFVREPAAAGSGGRPGALAALRGYGELFRLPHTLGIIALAIVTYAAFLALRGLWLGPLLIERHGFSLVQSGHVVVAVSLVGMAGPPLFGRLDPGDATRRRWIVGWTLVVAALFVVMAARPGVWTDVAASIAISLVAGYIVLQYADVKAAYPANLTGRAMSVFTMAMFLGVAVVQWLTGGVASLAQAHGVETYAAVLATIAALLGLGTAAFRLLPQPRTGRPPEPAQSAA